MTRTDLQLSAGAAGRPGSGPGRSRRGLPGVALAVLLAVAGCGQAPQDLRPEAEPAPVTYPGVEFPLDPFRLSDDQVKTINLARAMLIRDCLRQFGFEHPLPAEVVGNPFQTIDDRYGLVDEGHARQWGYRGKPPPSDAVPYEFTAPTSAHALLFEEQRSPNGDVLERGCVGAADTRLRTGSPAVYTDIVRQLDRDAWHKSRTDGRVEWRIMQWRECVGRTGRNYADPHEAVRQWNSADAAHGTPTPDEVAAAVADVQCKKSVDLTGVWAAVDIEYQQAAVEENITQLRALREAQLGDVENANRLVRGG